jgi:hypothetical protein
MKKIIAIVITSLVSFGAQSAIIEGHSVGNITNDGGGVFTYTFDTNFTTDRKNADGLFFQGNGSPQLNVTGSGTVIQDWPANGGLGVDGGVGGDNLTGTEWLNFALLGNTSFVLLGFTVNGGGDGHNDCFSGLGGLDLSTNKGIDFTTAADRFDGCGPDSPYNGSLDTLAAPFDIYADINWFLLSPRASSSLFSGHVESLTIRVDPVPEPSIIALFAAGLFGISFARRRQS